MSRTRSRGRTRGRREDGGATGKTPKTKMARVEAVEEGVDAEVDAVRAIKRDTSGFAGPGNASGTMARTGVANTGRARESAPPRSRCLRTSREGLHDGRRRRMQPAVAGVDEGVESHGDGGDEVVLDEARR
jgi:hypothetical protein